MMTVQSRALFWYALQTRAPRIASALAWLRREIISGVVLAPLEPVLHASQWRIAWAGLFTLVGHPLFGWIWSRVQPQPWESMRLRLAAGSLGIVLLVVAVKLDARGSSAQLLFNLIWWLVMPLLFFYLYLCNGGNAVWLASTTAMLLIYYHSVDWRIATDRSCAGVVERIAGILAVRRAGASAATQSRSSCQQRPGAGFLLGLQRS